eukprot:jgi/Tetstr1/422119/TSEL_012975.t2
MAARRRPVRGLSASCAAAWGARRPVLMRGGLPGGLLLPLAGLLLLALPARLVTGQQDQPLMGQGDPPPVVTDIYLNAFLERLLDVDDNNYKFQASMYFYLDWVDPRAAPEIARRTAEVRAGRGECERVCSGPQHFRSSWQTCCDTVWLPDFRIMNIEELPEGRVPHERIQVAGANQTAVTWNVLVQGVFYTSMEFRDFPFDEQNLNINVWLESEGHTGDETMLRLIPSATAMANPLEDLPFLPGNDVEGWIITSVSLNTTLTPLADIYNALESGSSKGKFQRSVPNEPVPISAYAAKAALNGSGDIAGVEEGYQPGFYVSIEVHRVYYIHMLNLLLPIFLCIWLGAISIAVEPHDLDTRVGIAVTLFLALVAVQFVSQDVVPSAANIIAMQQLIVLTYLYLGLLAVQAIISYTLYTGYTAQQRRNKFHESEQRAISELEEKGVVVGSSLPFMPPSSLRRSSKTVRSRGTVGGSLYDHGKVHVVDEELPSASPMNEGTAANDIHPETVDRIDPDTKKERSPSEMKRSDSENFFRRACSTLWYLPRNVRKVEHYGAYVAHNLDRVVLIAWLVSYHVFAVLIFVVNDVTA